MAPSKQPPQPFAKDEKVLCFHHEMLYEAKILDVAPTDSGDGFQYKIHYKGWKSTWDDWVPVDRIRKLNPENVELANQLTAQMKNLTQKSTKQVKKGGAKAVAAAESARGSEERGGAGTATLGGRGPRRARDYELEHVCFAPLPLFFFCYASFFYCFHRRPRLYCTHPVLLFWISITILLRTLLLQVFSRFPFSHRAPKEYSL